VFVAGATGGVGEAVVQVARMLGARVAGSTGAASVERARDLAVEPVFDYARTGLEQNDDLRGAFDVVFDASGSLPVQTAMRLLKKYGVFLDINATPAKFFRAALIRRHKIFFCKPTTQILTDAARAAVGGHVCMSIGERVPLESAIDLITSLETGRKISGKGLVVVGPHS
jgi:NADPH:quinone reductase-like Zn-dependent oxidoreductase